MLPNEGPLPADIAGPADARPIVFLHSVQLTRKMWLPQVEALSSEYRLIAPDLPGHGALAGVPFRLETAVEGIAGLIDREARGRALVVGLSLGGYVSMEVDVRYPAKAAGLILAGCSADPRGIITLPYRLTAFLSPLIDDRWMSALNAWVYRRMFPPFIAEAQIRSGFYFKAFPQVIRELAGRDFPSRLREFPGPVLFLNGERDHIFRTSEHDFVAAAPNTRLELVKHAGHLSNLEQPEAFTQIVRAFARSIGW